MKTAQSGRSGETDRHRPPRCVSRTGTRNENEKSRLDTADWDVMIKSAQSLRSTAPKPVSARAAIEPFLSRSNAGEMPAGFPKKIVLNELATDSSLALLTEFPECESLDLAATAVYFAGVPSLGRLPALRSLVLPKHYAFDSQDIFRAASKLTKLRHLELAVQEELAIPSLVVLTSLNELESIAIEWTPGQPGWGIGGINSLFGR